jgi:hypothetical protein
MSTLLRLSFLSFNLFFKVCRQFCVSNFLSVEQRTSLSSPPPKKKNYFEEEKKSIDTFPSIQAYWK